jgi:Xaa-Pro aminopeptidase
LSRTTTAVLSDRGDGAQTTVDQKTGGQAVRDQQFAAQLQVGLSALDVPLAPAATQIVRKGIENQTAAKAAIEGLSQLTDKPTIVQKTKAAMSAFIGKDENQIKTKLFNNFVEKTAGRSPAAITEREAVNKAAVVKHLLRDVDPANETEVRASSLTLKMMQEAKPDTFDWQSASFNKFNEVFEQMKSDLAKKTPDELSKIEKSPALQEQAFRKALEEEGATPKDENDLSGCWRQAAAAN